MSTFNGLFLKACNEPERQLDFLSQLDDSSGPLSTSHGEYTSIRTAWSLTNQKVQFLFTVRFISE